MKGAPISEAKRLGQQAGATAVVVLMVDDDGNYSCTTWGATKRQCSALKDWSEYAAEPTLMEIFEKTS